METVTHFHEDQDFILSALMGPSVLTIMDELGPYLDIKPEHTILDLGCGMGLSSLCLADRYGARTFAVDLWISPEDNLARFSRFGMDRLIIPLGLDVTAGLCFAKGYFDALVSLDSWHYYGHSSSFLPSILPYMKKNASITVVVPGLKADFPDGRVPDELAPFWGPDMNIFSTSWWRNLWQAEPGIKLRACREMDCCAKAWEEWLKAPNPYAQGDIAMMEAEGGKYFNLIQLEATVL